MSKFLDKQGLTTLWGRVKTLTGDKLTEAEVSAKVTEIINELKGKASGLATLGADSKITTSQLPVLKTINNESIVGSGNITIDLSLYRIVESLPTSDIDANKVYLVLGANTNPTENKYIEYIYVNNAWEKVGEYKAAVGLTDYTKFTDVVTDSKNGVMSTAMKTKLDGITENATKDEAITADELTTILV